MYNLTIIYVAIHCTDYASQKRPTKSMRISRDLNAETFKERVYRHIIRSIAKGKLPTAFSLLSYMYLINLDVPIIKTYIL